MHKGYASNRPSPFLYPHPYRLTSEEFMSVTLRAINPFSVVALCLLIAGGCNAFEFLGNEDATNDPDLLLIDARFALQDGDNEKAVELLEKALEAAPDNAEIKIELSSALFQLREIDLILMKDLADFITSAPEVQTGRARASKAASCNFDGGSSAASTLIFDDDSSYVSLFNNIETLQRVQNLLQNTLETEAAEALEENVVGNARMMRSLAAMGMAVIQIKIQADASQATLHRLPNGGIGYCAENPAALAVLESFVLCEQMPALDRAVGDLVFRQQLFGAGESELVTAVSSARDHFSSAITTTCQGVAG